MSTTYVNPVYDRSFPDPFVLKYCGEYWAYCTGFWHDGRCFGILHSRDLLHWRPLAGALEPLPGDLPCYWAPEVSYHNGRFYLYYSVGNETRMQIRVAVAEHPAGPFVDSGRRLTHEPFAIDAHVFDDDGARYLFYATDFLDRSHVGTGTVRDRLLDPYTPAGRPQPVVLPRYDWHVYDPRRAEKGGVRWHTVEGSFVLKRKGRYYHMFSGGNWQNITYGVSYAVADSLTTPGEWNQVADGEAVLPILRTLPGQVIGPGHNSVVRGPDNQQLFCVYHRWSQDGDARVLSIDPLDWAGERMLVLGPSVGPQPAPLRPAFADFFDGERADGLGAGWDCEGGRWSARGGAAVQAALAGDAAARCTTAASSFTAEVSLRSLDDPNGHGAYGISLGDELFFLLEPARQRILARVRRGGQRWEEQPIALPPEFAPGAYHLLRVEVDGNQVHISLDGSALHWTTVIPGSAGRLALRTRDMSAAFAGFALTAGWQDLFEGPDGPPADLGWTVESGDWTVREQQLWADAGGEAALIVKGAPLDGYELVVNARLEGTGCYGFYPAVGADERGPLLTVEPGDAGWVVYCREAAGEHSLALPGDFDPAVYQQFRFRKQDGRLAVQWESHQLGVVGVPLEATRVGLYARGARAAFEMVRVTHQGSGVRDQGLGIRG